MSSNKNIKGQRSARAARLKIKADSVQKHIQPLQRLYFEIPLPLPHTYTQPAPSNVTSSQVTITHHPLDERKENIKQKIKFRVKQELWNLLKKNNDKISASNTSGMDSPILPRKNTQGMAFVMGTSSTRFDRDSIHSKKHWYLSSPAEKKESSAENEGSFLVKEGERIRKNQRRGWSSVRMRERTVWTSRSQIRANRSAVQIEREVFEIEPWRL